MAEQVSGVKSFSNTYDFNGLGKPVNTYFVVPDYVADEFKHSAQAAQEPEKVKKKHKAIKIIGGTLAGLLLAVGCVRAMPKSIVKQFDKLKEFFIKKSEEVTTSSKMAVFYRRALARMRVLSEKARGFNNFVSFKDIWFERVITDKVPLLKRICHKTTAFFDNIGQKVVKSTYNKSLKKFKKLELLYTNLESEILKDGNAVVKINGVEKTKTEWVQVLELRRRELANILENNFNDGAINGRNKKMKGFMSDLGDKVWAASFGTKGSFKNKDTYFTFWADKFLASDKSEFGHQMNKLRSSVKLGRHDKIKMCEELVDNGKKFIHPQDISSEKTIRELNKLFTEYKGSIDKHPENLEEIASKILQKLDDYTNVINHGKETFKYDEAIVNALNSQNSEIRNILTSKERGCIDEMNEIYRAILSEKDYRHVKQTSKNAVNSLDNAIKTETNDYFDKLRDWTLGAAPTDVVGVLGGFASMGGALALTQDKEKRKSILLKAGIPALGGATVMMVMTSMLMSGAKGLTAGLISSFILNKIGSFADNKRKQYIASNTNV